MFSLSSNEMRQVATLGLGGLIVGALYQTANVLFMKSIDEYDLDPKTEALQHFSDAYHGFYRMSRYREFNEPAYRNAVGDADRLSLLANNVKTGTIKTPTSSHELNAVSYLRNVSKQLKRIETSAFNLGKGREASSIRRIRKEIYDELRKVYREISKRVNSLSG